MDHCNDLSGKKFCSPFGKKMNFLLTSGQGFSSFFAKSLPFLMIFQSSVEHSTLQNGNNLEEKNEEKLIQKLMDESSVNP